MRSIFSFFANVLSGALAQAFKDWWSGMKLQELGAEKEARQQAEAGSRAQDAMDTETSRERSSGELRDRLKKGTF